MKLSLTTLLLVIFSLFYLAAIWATMAFANQEDKVYWCHTEPNGNQQTLHLPLQALENAGHVNAEGNALHAGDHVGECIEASPAPSPTIEPSPEPSVEPSPSPSIDPSPTPEVSPSPTPSIAPLSTPSPTVSPTPSPEVKPVEQQYAEIMQEIKNENPELIGVVSFK